MPALLRSLARSAAPGLLFFLAACQRPPVAVVNGQAISRTELAAQVRVLQSVRPEAADDAATRRLVLEQLIRQDLLVSAARRAGLDQDPALKAAIAQQSAAARQRLGRQLAGLQAQLDFLEQSVEAKVLVDAWSQSQRKAITITAQDLLAAYAKRSAAGPLPPFQAVRDQLLDQMILDRLEERERAQARIQVDEGAVQ
ncbi:MAG TPA: SurA N-terminal domain-containing protein [bacterium]|nr:SurA N-terminal domain-containing protein [bacterium]